MTEPAPHLGPRLSIVIGMQYALANLPAILAALRPGLIAEQAEVLLCHAADDPLGLAPQEAALPGLRIVTGAAGALIPALWRDGIVAARSTAVALLSGHCVPDAQWLDRALTLDLDRCAGYGGLIVNDPASDAVGAAIHLLRYHGFASAPSHAPAPRAVREIAADNAVYRREAIMACTDLLEGGFWEPAYHARFRARGLGLELCPDLIVTHVNRYSPRQFMRQRRWHGRNFGLSRARAAPAQQRWVMLLGGTVAAFPVFAVKLTTLIRRDPVLRPDLARAAPWFYLFLANWSLGEVWGYASAVFGARR